MAQYFEQPLGPDRLGARVSFDDDTGEVELVKHDELIKLDYSETLILLEFLRMRELLLKKWRLRQGTWDGNEGA